MRLPGSDFDKSISLQKLIHQMTARADRQRAALRETEEGLAGAEALYKSLTAEVVPPKKL
ncbi:MAG: hypothetical protein [Microvirus sp.]|nr:MAG: hypothetical protein [Microvirus sp.]